MLGVACIKKKEEEEVFLIRNFSGGLDQLNIHFWIETELSLGLGLCPVLTQPFCMPLALTIEYTFFDCPIVNQSVPLGLL